MFGENARSPAFSGTKGYYGHALGAIVAIEAAICSLALTHDTLPGTCNLVEPDPACELHILHRSEACHAQTILSTSFGFGGMNAALLIGRYAG